MLTREAIYVPRNIEALSRNHCCREETGSIFLFARASVCMLAGARVRRRVRACSLTQNAKRKGHLLLSSLASLASHMFRHYLIIDKIFGKKVMKYKIFFLIFSTTLSETFLILRRNQ